MRPLLVALVLLAGCTVGDTGGGGGGTGNGDGTPDLPVDAGAGSGSSSATCTNAVYDPCSDASQCTSGRCQLFQQSGFQVCTTTCTPGDSTTCPMQNGQPAQCNNMGICKPAGPNSCTR